MTDFFDRLDQFMEYKGLNDNKITIETGISNGLIGKGRKRGTLSQGNISKILSTYKELDANWLLTGNGSMIKRKNTLKESSSETLHVERIYKGLLHEKDNTIQELNREIGGLQEKVRRLKDLHNGGYGNVAEP